MSNKLKSQIDPLAGGEYCWYMAGGGAAWWHIDNHMHTFYGAHDWNYFESVKEIIFPGDVEGNALKQVDCKFASKQGMIDVRLSEMTKAMFDEKVEQLCVKVEGIWVVSPLTIIKLYGFSGDPDKQEKRDIRSGMLQLVLKGLPITQQNVENNKPRGGGILAGIGALKLRPPKKIE